MKQIYVADYYFICSNCILYLKFDFSEVFHITIFDFATVYFNKCCSKINVSEKSHTCELSSERDEIYFYEFIKKSETHLTIILFSHAFVYAPLKFCSGKKRKTKTILFKRTLL